MPVAYKSKNKKKLKVLHVASFLGNIGDYANHQGFYKMFSRVAPAQFTQLEIRKFYKNRGEMKFDDSFAEMANKHDLLVLGGGGFFDLQWEHSDTGTTIDLTEKIIGKIKVPVLVNAMGYHEYGEVEEKNVDKFKNFLGTITNKDSWFVSVRNDGSLGRIHNRYGNVADKILKVPDNGFFYSPKKYTRFNLGDKRVTWIGLNITNDLFNKKFNKDLDVATFNDLIGQFADQILKENSDHRIIFFPHAHQDVVTIGAILNKIEDKFKRERIVVAPFFTQEDSIGQVFDLYRICSCIVGMRFHANVCGLGMNIPTIGLAGHEQISSLYEELGIPERCIKANNINFIPELADKLSHTITLKKKISADYLRIKKSLDTEAASYFHKVNKWLGR
jgi:polysaccharide pyruvyl transferase WcaK-like protein